MKDAIYFDDYDVISDTLLQLGYGCTLNMCVKIGSKSQQREKLPFHQEYLYRTTKYVNKDAVISTKRKFFPYLAIEWKSNDVFGKDRITITHYDILGFREKVLEADRALLNCFALKEQELIIPSNMNFQITSMPSDGVITFMPTVIEYDDGTKSPGVMMDFSGKMYVNIPIKTWKAFVYYIMTVDLYGWAASIVSGYTNNMVGENVQDMRGNPRPQIMQDDEMHERKVGFRGDKKKSFFD